MIVIQPVQIFADGCLAVAVSLICFAAFAQKQMFFRAIISDGCFSGFTVLALSKYATICNPTAE
jgi:hypothetical protein